MVNFAGFGISISGLRTSSFRQNVTANNLANSLTTGFRASRANVVDQVGGGAHVGATPFLSNPGPIEITQDGRFKLALRGDGFFVVRTSSGLRYTRAGAFQLDANRNLVTPDGYQLDPPLQLPNEARGFHVNGRGQVSALMPDGTTQAVGQLRLARFNNPGGLRQEGNSLYAATAASGDPSYGTPGQGAFGSTVFGALEGSNVDLAAQMVELRVNRHAFSANLRALQVRDELLGELIDMRG